MRHFINQLSFVAGTPRYIQLADFLEQAIKSNEFNSRFLPPERELAQLLKVSRVTVSNALNLLEKKNLIVRQQGLGTQINSPFNYSLNQLSGFTERMENAGYSVSDCWLNKIKTVAPHDIARQLGVSNKSEVSFLQRVRFIDNCPISIESTYTPLDVLPDPENFNGSLYAYWANKKIYISKKTIYFHAISCDAISAKLLQQKENAPLLKILEINRDNKKRVIEVSEIQCISQYYALKFEL